MELNAERSPEMDIEAFREALQRIQDQCHRLFGAQDLNLPTPERTQRLGDQLCALVEETNHLSRLEVAHDLVEPLHMLDILLMTARVYARSAGEPLKVETASTHPTDLAIRAALPRIRDQCNRIFVEQDFTLRETERVARIFDQILELTEEFQEITGLVFDDQGRLEPFEQQNAVRAINMALHEPMLQIHRHLEDAWTFAIASLRSLGDHSHLVVEEAPSGDVTHLDKGQAAVAVAGMPRKTAGAIKTGNKAAGATEPEFQNSCMICCRDWEDEDEIVELPCHFTHVLHEECARELLLSCGKCPLCRKPIP